MKKNVLKQIVHNTESKRSVSIIVSDNKPRFKTWFSQKFNWIKKKDYEIALINLETYYTFPIIDPTIVLLIHQTLPHYGLTLLFQKVVITLKISMSSFNEK